MATARFHDLHVFREHVFSLGLEPETGLLYLSTPVSSSNRMIDYEAWFRIDRASWERFAADPASAAGFLEDCRMGRNAHLRIAP